MMLLVLLVIASVFVEVDFKHYSLVRNYIY